MWKKAKSSRPLLGSILFGAVFISILPGCSLLPKEEQALKPPLVKPVKENFEVFEVKKSTVTKQISGVGIFASDKMQYLYYSESGGRLSEILVQMGAVVKKGDVVALLEKGEIEGKIRLQDIVVEKAKVALELAKDEQRGNALAIRMKVLDVQKEEIQLEMLKEQLAKTKLVSEVDGIVTYIDPLKQGDPVTAYRTLLTVSDPRSMKLVYETTTPNDLTGVQVGMEATIKYKSNSYQGKVAQIPATAPQSDVKAIQDKNAKSIVIVTEGLPSEIEIGNSGDIVIVTEKRENVLVIPKLGLRSYLGRDYVQVLDGESRKEIDVEKGIVSATEVEIRKGLKEGQKVILNN
ncbi:efflux RND transporter periplasmic adaptor subunit [Paenibacillus radicis (ex Xue et al. 2023)]|uniref:HlyD family efflux transporter periplasmic adaptor subunit n=1 Tax=Paenibacillus radicis (ex Xue et al. 2023) TaxID=2972489 RepID=A0ABT1YIP1_9BACL|nr:HlyD family efflux transporter periplasmic adaptor subunit [Paenibacillus radicis (ex Xue et al. 2023)]MCR8631830.1 HlyD family efflux transporter periplasmic adaptor subunit [Paenibacillus radicis (ex Xue et al. 2023)]